MPVIKFKKLNKNAIIPFYATDGASGMDLSIIGNPSIYPGSWRIVHTGLAVIIPPGYEGQIRPRSGLAVHHGITVLNSPGTIDADYRGEICILLVNHSNSMCQLQAGDRVAQLVIAPVAKADVEVVEDFDIAETTARNSGGFGSTGK